MAWTKETRKTYAAKYRQDNKEKISAYDREYYQSNKEERNTYNKKYYQDNKEKVNASDKEYRHKNREKISARDKEYRQDNREKINAHRKEYRQNNKEKVSAQKKKYQLNNKKKITTYRKEYYQNNRERIKEYSRNNKERINVHRKEYYQNDPKYKINHIMSAAIRDALRSGKAGKSWLSMVGYTSSKLMKHLETLFQPGMSWKNHGKGPGKWEIDHIIPKSVFNFTKPEDEDFKKCWALSNLQPMWSPENLSKGAKLEKHFQPSLIFG